MFTGIIEGLGTIAAVQSVGKGKRITIATDFSIERMAVGDSIAVNGACLTAVRIDRNRFEADLSPETVARTTFASCRIGDRVNLERALRLSDRIDGHLVWGHIDGIGTISRREPAGNAVMMSVAVSEALTRYMIPKGSVAVEGVSLTVNEVGGDRFEISIIPLTAKVTTLVEKKVGGVVNIETDMIGKYVARFMSGTQGQGTGNDPKKSMVDMAFLANTGFL